MEFRLQQEIKGKSCSFSNCVVEMSNVQLDAFLHFAQKEREDRRTRALYYQPLASYQPIVPSYPRSTSSYQPFAPSYQARAPVYQSNPQSQPSQVYQPDHSFNSLFHTTTEPRPTEMSFSDALLRPPELLLSNLDDPMFDPSSLARFEHTAPPQTLNNIQMILDNAKNDILSIDGNAASSASILEDGSNVRMREVYREAAAQGRKSNSTVESPCECTKCNKSIGTLSLRGKQACFEDAEEWSVDVLCLTCLPVSYEPCI
jgi:hypothetical protein